MWSKPNRLKAVLKRGEHIPTDAEVIAAVDTLIEGYMNCDDYGGSVAEDKKARAAYRSGTRACATAWPAAPPVTTICS